MGDHLCKPCLKVCIVAKQGHANTGVGRYTLALARELRALGHEVTVVHPVVPLPRRLTQWLHRWLGWDLKAFFNNYPVWIRYTPASIYHFSSQNLATLLLFRPPPGKTVVTVHDVIPWMVKDNPEIRVYRHFFDGLFDQCALQGLQRTDALVADSTKTFQDLTLLMRSMSKPFISVHEAAKRP